MSIEYPVKLAWATDIHLNFVTPERIADFCRRIAEPQPHAVLLGGDIGEAASLEPLLRDLEARLPCPIYFVLGNHDFYHGSIRAVRTAMARLTASSARLKWLPAVGTVELSPTTALVGHDGWGDGRAGNPLSTAVMLNDYVLIDELKELPLGTRLARQRALGDEAATHLSANLPAALERYAHVIVLTHVPPFREACWHEGKISGEDWLPHFVCQATGDVLLEAARAWPDRTVTVLCGHTHGEGTAQMLPNLSVRTGGAAYGWPAPQDLLTVS